MFLHSCSEAVLFLMPRQLCLEVVHYISYNMNKSGLFLLLGFLILILSLLYLPYRKTIVQDDQLIDSLLKFYHHDSSFYPNALNLIPLILFYPVLLILEATLKKRIVLRLIFILQAILIGILGSGVWFIMSWCLFCSTKNLVFGYYIIMVYLILGIVWNILLAIPHFKDHKIIYGSFVRLSLLK